MPTKKIADLPESCNHPEHNPPMYQHFEAGVYEHTCPKCGKVKRFTVHRNSMSAMSQDFDDETPDYIVGNEDGI